MSSEKFARDLIEDAKLSLQSAKATSIQAQKQRHLRHALMMSFSFLELQLSEICRHLEGANQLSVQERGALLQKEVILKKGTFQLSSRTRYYSIEDRLSILQKRFAGSDLGKKDWWGKVSASTGKRNSIAHPRGDVTLKEGDVRVAIASIIECVDSLFRDVFGKGLPYASLGLTPKQ